MKKLILLFFILVFPFFSSAQEPGSALTNDDASVEYNYITHSKVDSTGGVQKPGGLYFSVDVDVAGFPLSVTKRALDPYRGPDVLNPCAYFAYSGSSTDPAICQILINAAGDVVNCDPTTEYFSGVTQKCEPKECGLGLIKNPNAPPACITYCPPGDQHVVAPGECGCNDPNKKLNNSSECVVACRGNQEPDPDNPGQCKCPDIPGWSQTPDANGMCQFQCGITGTSDPDGDAHCTTDCPEGKTDPTDSGNPAYCCIAGEIYSEEEGKCVPSRDCTDPLIVDPDYPDPGHSDPCKCPGNTVKNPSYSETNPDSEMCVCPVGKMPDDAVIYGCKCDPNYTPTPPECANTCPRQNDPDGQEYSIQAGKCLWKCLNTENDIGSQCCNGSGQCCYKDPAVTANTCATHPPLQCARYQTPSADGRSCIDDVTPIVCGPKSSLSSDGTTCECVDNNIPYGGRGAAVGEDGCVCPGNHANYTDPTFCTCGYNMQENFTNPDYCQCYPGYTLAPDHNGCECIDNGNTGGNQERDCVMLGQ